ncbi:Hypothetical protein, putative [Bodo saltans]|uniref:Uncharacterized protein n=1 Tax=Bodo saltans TaxID=75058 RepID=A0A0S4JN89_BODSA|nr:Hypothetical protein, putative [Bodo saltans]|eukprot:CUG89973.1 Hypothetical protein, putative [Bodo saltans]
MLHRGLNDYAQRKLMLEPHKSAKPLPPAPLSLTQNGLPQARPNTAGGQQSSAQTTTASPQPALQSSFHHQSSSAVVLECDNEEAMPEGVVGEIYTARAGVNAVMSELAPQLAPHLPHATVLQQQQAPPLHRGGGGKSQFVRPASGAVSSSAAAGARRRPQSTKSAHEKVSEHRPKQKNEATTRSPPRSPPRPQPYSVGSGEVHGFRFLPPTDRSDVELEILHWRQQAAEKQSHQHQSLFQWAMAELNAIDAHDSATIRDGPAPTIPSHFSVHALYTIFGELLGALCPWTELQSRLLGKLKDCLFLPRKELVQNFSSLGHSKIFLQTVSNMPLFEFGEKDEDEEDSWDAEGSKRDPGASCTTAEASFAPSASAAYQDASAEGDTPSNQQDAQGEEEDVNTHVHLDKLSKLQEAAAAAAAADSAGEDASWSLVVQMQDARIGTLLQKLRMNNSAIVALRGLLKSVFNREDRSLQRVSFNGWRSIVHSSNQQQKRLIRFFDHSALVIFKGMFFRRWARAVAVGRRQRLIRAKDEAVHSAKQMERRLREAVQVGREEVTRELEKVKATLSDERGTRERQLSSMLAEMEALGDRIGGLNHYLKLTVTHKNLWRTLWLTHHRENRLPQLLIGTLKDEAGKFRDALRVYVGAPAAGGAKGRSPVHPSSSGAAEESVANSEPVSPQAGGDNGALVGQHIQRTTTPAGGGANSTPTQQVQALNQTSSARAALRLKLETVLIAWVNDVLVRLHVQRFLIAVRDDLSDGVIFAALAFALDRTRSPTERFMEESVRRLSPAALGRRLVGALKQASRRSASCFQGIPMLQLYSAMNDRFDEKAVLSLTSVEDPWYLWALATLFVDYCMLQVYPEPLESPNGLAPSGAQPAGKKKTSRSPSTSEIGASPATTAAGPPLPPPRSAARLMCKDATQFLIHQDSRSDLHVPEIILDAADYVASSPMRPYTGHRLLGGQVPSVVIKRSSAGGGGRSVGGHAPSLFPGGGGSHNPSLSTNATDPKGKQALQQHLQQKHLQQLRPVTAFHPSGPTSPTHGVSPSTSNLGTIRKKVPAPPHASSAGSNFGRSRGRAAGAVSPDQASQFGSGNVSPTSNSPTPTADPSQGGFQLDPTELAGMRSFGPTPVNTPDGRLNMSGPSALESLLPLMRGKTEHSGIAQMLNDVLGDGPDEDEDDDDDTREPSVDSNTARMDADERRALFVAGAGHFDEFDAYLSSVTTQPQHQSQLHAAATGANAVSPTTGLGDVVTVHERSRRGSVEFVGTSSRPNTPIIAQQLSPVSPVDDGISMYDAVICGKMQAEGMQRKKAWTDVARLVITAVCSYGILDRFQGQSSHSTNAAAHSISSGGVTAHQLHSISGTHPNNTMGTKGAGGSAMSISAKSSSVLSRVGGGSSSSGPGSGVLHASLWDPKNASVSHVPTPTDGPLNAPLHHGSL